MHQKTFTCKPAASFGNLLLPLMMFMLLPLTAAFAQHAEAGASPHRVEISSSEVQTLLSSVSGQEYKLYMHLPANYRESGKKYPVLYLLDAQ
jgi:enterochelin esterase-like enzyme